ncbi:RNA-directed DNA polymerase, eukaryota [Tanacetum coccineum]|uniref:RNA-directed DNA polymerase, eukaryota n=1 Tax=Tanacetum coccineum TaxID=301880 RepID=A0ABQ5HJK3_9ASTR
MIFKVDFEKAFDSVTWDYLIDSLKAFGFSQKWCNWIKGCLKTAMGSVLVNGSPTPEFQFHKGLKQGDPISPFLFILVMETLHLSFKRVINENLYKGLKINLQKSKLLGIGVNSNVVERAASTVGCSTFPSPFKYFGVKVGGNMSRIDSWDEVITKVSTRLSKRKIKTLSIGINLTQFIRKKVGNGVKSLFWEKCWVGEIAFKSLVPRLFALEESKSISVADKLNHPSLVHSFRRLPRGGAEEDQLAMLCSRLDNVILSNMDDRWCWNLNASGSFSIKSTRSYIDDLMLPNLNVPTRWVKVVPIKVNIHAWKVCLDKLPTRLNLSIRGIDIPSILCPICNSYVESSSHIFFSCSLARINPRSLIGVIVVSYLFKTPNYIMFAVYAYARYQVNPKVSHLYAVKRIFRVKNWDREVVIRRRWSSTLAQVVSSSVIIIISVDVMNALMIDEVRRGREEKKRKHKRRNESHNNVIDCRYQYEDSFHDRVDLKRVRKPAIRRFAVGVSLAIGSF